MKQLTIIACAALFMMACSSEPTVGEKAAQLFDQQTAKVKAASSIDELMALEDEVDINAELEQLAQDANALIVDGDSTEYKAETAKAQAAYENYLKAVETKMAELLGIPLDATDDAEGAEDAVAGDPVDELNPSGEPEE